MKKTLSFLLALAVILSLSACGAAKASEPTTLYVFAAASLTESMDKVIELYRAVEPGVTVVPTYDSSGTLKTQIEEGADCDLFISAAQKQMNQLDISKDEEANPDRLDFVLDGSRKDLLENKVVLAVPEGNPKGIAGFDDMAKALAAGGCLMAMGGADVPVGQYTSKILAYFGLDEAALASSGVITYGSNVKEVTTQISEASADFGVVYATDAFSAGLETVDTATAEMCGRVVYPAAVMKTGAHPDAARSFLNFLSSDGAAAVFEGVGFTMVG